MTRPAACAHCRRTLKEEFFFTCRRCGASYCYIHMARHDLVACSRRRAVVAESAGAPVPLPPARAPPSANV